MSQLGGMVVDESILHLYCIDPGHDPFKFSPMGIYRRSRTHKGIKDLSKKCRLRRRTKDLDQIERDLIPGNKERLLKEVVSEDLPGGGNFLCVECSRHFIDEDTLDAHKGTKIHKKRLKCLAEGAYTIEEANAAGGSGSTEFYTKRVEKMKGLQEVLKAKNFKKIEVNAEAKVEIGGEVEVEVKNMMTYE